MARRHEDLDHYLPYVKEGTLNQEQGARRALERLRALRRGLPPVDAVEIVRAGRESLRRADAE